VEPHALVLELHEARAAKKVMLYLTGWIFYSDTSIAVSLSQGKAMTAGRRCSRSRTETAAGGWRSGDGLSVGKTKTIPVDLSNVLNRRDPRVRIQTNLDIAWIGSSTPSTRRRRPPDHAGPARDGASFFRGFSKMMRETPGGPQVFVHDEVETAPRWADMAGLYTRFGDVRELLTSADDRYVVMKGEMPCAWNLTVPLCRPCRTAGRAITCSFSTAGTRTPTRTRSRARRSSRSVHGMDDARYGEGSQAYPATRRTGGFARST